MAADCHLGLLAASLADMSRPTARQKRGTFAGLRRRSIAKKLGVTRSAGRNLVQTSCTIG
eukprot:scaffold2607_cov254-Pinguiococcus_pyrenoidosus.AAC.1